MELKIVSASPPVDTTALGAVAGLVANIVAPGSGQMVAGVVNKGAAILANVVAFFKRRKEAGDSDAAAAAAAADTISPTEAAQIAAVATADAAYQKYLGTVTAEDYKLSTLLKRAKISGNLDLNKVYADAVNGGQINPLALGIYAYLGEQKGTAGAYSLEAPVGAIVPGQPAKYPSFFSFKRILAVALMSAALYIEYVGAPNAAKAAAVKKARQNAAKAARAAKQEAAQQEAAKKRVPRRIVKKS